MRILYLHQYFATPDSPWITRSYEMAKRLVEYGHQVHMVTSSSMLPEQYQFPKTTEVDIDGIHTIIIPLDYSNEMSFSERIKTFLMFSMLSLREAMKHKADVVFATSTPLTIAIPGIWAHLWQRIPMVFEVRDLWPEMPIAVGALKNPIAIKLARALEWITYRTAKHIVALSPDMSSTIHQQGIPEKKLTTIPNSCDTALFDVPQESGLPIRRKLGITQEQPLIIYTGTFGLLNGVGYMVDLAANMLEIYPDTRFLIVGDGAQKDLITRKARETGVLEKNLWIWEPIPKKEMAQVLAAATVATSLFIPLEPMQKNSANKFFDALAAGKPVAINYGGWQAELLHSTGAGLHLSVDPTQAAHQLAEFIQNTEQLQNASQASQKLAYETFNRDLMAKKLEQVLLQAVQA